jgi:hypothetical protein
MTVLVPLDILGGFMRDHSSGINRITKETSNNKLSFVAIHFTW